MLRHILPRRCAAVSMAEDCIAAGSFRAALGYLTMAKQPTVATAPCVDYLRALCFLRLKDPLSARKALVEELGHTPTNEDARDLLQRINTTLRETFVLPESIVESEPLFARIYDELKHQNYGIATLAWPRLLTLYNHAKDLCERGVEGDFVECGVSDAGSSVLLAAVAKHYSPNRRVIACDNDTGTNQFAVNNNAQLQELSSAFGVNVFKASGSFDQLLPRLVEAGVVGDVALLHLDCDWYESTKAAIGTLYPKVVTGGVVQVDDFCYWDGCKKAIYEHLDRSNLSVSSLQHVDGTAVFFRKE